MLTSMHELTAARILANEDLYFYSRLMFFARKGFKWRRAPHHPAIFNALMKVFTGEINRLIINVPPRYSKTEAVINFISWALGKVPDSEFILTSYAGGLATNNAWIAREMIQHETYQALFPGVMIRSDSSAKGEWRTTENGIVYAAGAGGTITGYGAGKHREGFGGAIVVDDPHKPDEANSQVMRQNVIDWFQNTLESRKNDPTNTPIIVIMQRLHEEDLSGWLLKGGNGEKWHHICLPAEAEAGDMLGREIGTPLWPEKHTSEMLARMKAANPYVYAGQYQQRPAPLGGGILKGQWFRYYKQLPRMVYRKIFADTAQKTKEHNDYSVLQCWGKGEDGCAYLIDQIRGKWEAPELKRRTIAFWQKHIDESQFPSHIYGALRQMVVEDKASGTGLIQDLKVSGSIPVIGVERVKDKVTRVLDIVGYVEAGRIYLPEEAPFTNDLVAECEAFTPNDTHMHDDQIDPMCDAINDMVATGNLISVWSAMAGDE
jgi:predicted phage terminase large subunit-like protein